jgi:predicted CXXCH cytochrome family protein
MDCHSQAVKAADGRVIAAVPELNDPRTIKHGPIKDGQCTGCHRTHGGQRPMLLVKDYSEAFYQRYNPANYDLCFSCHDVNLAQQEQSKGLTGFRDGDRNLHFVHVDKSDRSRNCGVCHSTHASANPRHMRDWTLFGKWKLPIGFTKTANGGTCESGCHGTFSYDRVHPVGPATQPVRLATRVVAAAAPPPTVHWNVQDATGAKITVPAAGRTAVLVFIRAEADPQDILKLVSQAITPQRSAQALVIVGGAQAADRTKALVQARATPWPIVADADCLLSRQLGLYAWPATLVIQPDGTQLAHLSGTPQHLTAELEAYLDFAAGRIDQAMLNRKLATRQVADDGADKKVAAYHDLAELLMAEGKPEQARVMLVDALKLRPDLPSLQVSMVKALLQLKRTDDAAAVLNKLPPGATPDWQRNLLRARLLLARNQWQQAKAALADVLKARPDLSEAHYAMAEIYEHERDWQKAAESYRAARAAERK